MNSCIHSITKEWWVVTSACLYLKCLISSGGRTESCSASPRHDYHSHAMWPCARHTHRQGKPSTFMINRQAKLHSKPSVIMKEVNLQDRGDREQCGGRREQELTFKGFVLAVRGASLQQAAEQHTAASLWSVGQCVWRSLCLQALISWRDFHTPCCTCCCCDTLTKRGTAW